MKIGLPSRLSWKLLAAILPPVILAVGAIVWLQYSLARRELLTSIDRQMRDLAQGTASDIDDLLEQRHRDLFTLADAPLIADYYRNVDYGLLDEAESYRKELERYLGNFAARSGVYARILYLDSRGRVVCRVGGKAGSPSEFSRSDFLQAEKTAGADWWQSPVEQLPGSGPVVYYAKLIRDDRGILKGMIVLAYDLSNLRKLLRTVEVGNRGRAYLRTKLGRVIAGAGPLADKDLLVASSRLERRSWTVFVEAPLQDFLQPLREIRRAAILTALLGGAILMAVLLWLVRSLTRPIATLVEAARRVGEGDLSRRIENPGGDELGRLSAAFNEMAEGLVQNRRQLIQAEKLSAVGQLISAVAHELNNPLSVISGYVQMSLLQEDVPPALHEDLSHMYKNVLRCRKVVENLLLFVRQSRHERRRVSLNEAAASALELLDYRLTKTEDVRVVQELSPSGPQIAGDYQQIVQVLVNLVSNACDAMQDPSRSHEEKRLTIRTGRGEDSVFLVVEDNGPGIPPELRERVFQPFFTTKEARHGTGLGLSICRQIVEEHGGRIELLNPAGGGTAFRLSFPPVREGSLAPDEDLSTPAPFEAVPGKKILVADDEAEIADMIARLLREDGDEVSVAYSGTEALKLLESARYDLLVTDIEMEGAKGMDLYAALAARGALDACRVLFVTGDILNAKVLEFLAKTRSEYLVKPFDIREMRQTARRLLRHPPK